MNSPEISQYHRDLASLLNSEPNRAQRRTFLVEERKTPEYQTAKKEAIKRTHPELTLQEQRILWAQKTIEDYSNLPRGNNRRKKVKAFLETAANYLFQHPQEIEIVVSVWKAQADHKGGFYEAIAQVSAQEVKKNWQKLKSETIREFVIAYSHSVFAKDFAKEMLRSYFKGPGSRRQRVEAYYTFVFSVLDLVEDKRAFETGVKIGLYDTDILPKEPYLIEQNVFISLPYNEDERVFQKLLIAKYAIFKLSTMGSEGLRILRQKEVDFANSSGKVQIMWEREQAKAEKKIGRDKVMRLNNAMNAFADSKDSLPIEMTDEDNWVQRIFRDETDPLNQKFKKVLSKRTLAEKA